MFLKLVFKDQVKKINFNDDLKDLDKLKGMIRDIKAWNVKDFTLTFLDPENEIVEIYDKHDMDYFLALNAHQKFASLLINECEDTKEKTTTNDQEFIDLSRLKSSPVDVQAESEDFLVKDEKTDHELEKENTPKMKMEQLIYDINDLIIDKNIQTDNLQIVDQGISVQPDNEDKSVTAVVEIQDQIVGENVDSERLYHILQSHSTYNNEHDEEKTSEKEDDNCNSDIESNNEEKYTGKEEKKKGGLKKKFKKMKNKMKKQEEKLMKAIEKKVSALQSQINNISMNNSRASIVEKPKDVQLPPKVNCMTVHTGVTCDNCEMYPIIGKRYKCMTCSDYDLCESCEQHCIHNHPMVRMMSTANHDMYRQISNWSDSFNAISNTLGFVNRFKNNEEGSRCSKFRKRRNHTKNFNNNKTEEKDADIKHETVKTEEQAVEYRECPQRRKEKSELIDFIFGGSKDEAVKIELLDRYSQLNIEDFYIMLQNNIDSL